MTSNFIRVALTATAFAALVIAPQLTWGTVTPSSGTEVGLDHDPEGIMVANGVTDASGSVTFRNLAPGNYVLIIDGKGLVASMDRLMPPAPEKKESHSSFSLGIGGFSSGGGSSHRSTSSGGGGAGPVGAGPATTSHGSSHSGGGGMGMGVNVAVGDVDGDGVADDRSTSHGSPEAGYPITSINIILPSNPDKNTANWGSGTSLNFKTPYCRDAASHGMRIGFSVPKGGGVRLEISDQASSGNLMSY